MKTPRFLLLLLALAFAHRAACAAEPTLAEAAAKYPHATTPIAVPRTDDELIVALRTAFADPLDVRHQKNVLDLVAYITPQNIARVIGLFDEFDREGVRQDFAWRAVWFRWGEIDGPGVFDFLLSDETQEKAGHWHFQDAMDGWAAVDPAAAEGWLREHREAPHYVWLYGAIVWGWALRDAREATRFAFALARDKDEPGISCGNIAESTRRQGGIARTIAWFESLDGPTKLVAMNHAAWRIKDGDLQTAARWFAAQVDKPWRDDKHLHDFVRRYAHEEPRAAAAWVVALPLPADAKYPPGIGTVLDEWTAKNPVEAAAWLQPNAAAPWWPRAALAHVKQLRKGKDDGAADKYLDALDADHRQAIREAADEK